MSLNVRDVTVIDFGQQRMQIDQAWIGNKVCFGSCSQVAAHASRRVNFGNAEPVQGGHVGGHIEFDLQVGRFHWFQCRLLMSGCRASNGSAGRRDSRLSLGESRVRFQLAQSEFRKLEAVWRINTVRRNRWTNYLSLGNMERV